jgi:hypothetical protein
LEVKARRVEGAFPGLPEEFTIHISLMEQVISGFLQDLLVRIFHTSLHTDGVKGLHVF